MRAKLEESAKNAADAKLHADITDAVIEKLEGETPDAMINNRVDDLVVIRVQKQISGYQ
ncbi:MAG: hypothetical protein ACLS48_06515 [[Eubacterium] siraeum]